MNLIARLTSICPRWRELYGDDPIAAAIELGLVEPDILDDTQPLDFNSERTQREAEEAWHSYMQYVDGEDSDA